MARSVVQPEPPKPLALSAKALRTVEPPISDLMARALQTPGLISFAAGLVDEETLPAAAARTVCRRVLATPACARAALQYGTTLGLKPLREALVEHIAGLEGRSARSMNLSADQILLTTGSQQSLYLVADTLVNPGDIVIAARPSYFVFTGVLSSLGARVLTVPMDDRGMIVSEVDRLLAKLSRTGELARVKFIYCTSYYQNPTGLTLSLSRRRELLAIAQRYSRRHRILIIEDAAYRELRYETNARPLPSIRSMDKTGQYVLLAQTFSKPFAPGLKLGYTAMPPDLLQQVLRQKGNHDFGSANLCQHIALEAMQSGAYAKHVRRLCGHYRRKRDLLLAALRQHLPRRKDIHWTVPGGGLYVWLTLPDSIDTGGKGELFRRCLEAGVLYVPGEYAFAEQGTRNQMRLCFGQVQTRQIREGMRRFAGVVNGLLERGGTK